MAVTNVTAETSLMTAMMMTENAVAAVETVFFNTFFILIQSKTYPYAHARTHACAWPASSVDSRPNCINENS